jgi:putative NIF3 family GTP cyclohydrolase 1 type 2
MAVAIQKLYDTMLKMGQKNDPRSQKEIDAMMADRKKAYDKLEGKKKEYFYKDSLVNPYGDSGVMYGDMKRTVKTALVCIDADKQEVVLAHALKGGKNEVDMIISHHPEGRGLVDLTRVMSVQETVMVKHGVSINIVEKLLAKRISELDRGLHPINHYQPIDAARLLDIPYMCCHTPADNSVHAFMEDFVDKRASKLKTVGDLMEAFFDIEEFQEAERLGTGPMIFAGSPTSKLGKIAVMGMTGGTSGNDDIFEQLSRAGVGTVISMHMGEKPREKAEKYHLNVVITGHMASDSLGLNLVLDHMEKDGLKIVPGGGFIRVKRKV